MLVSSVREFSSFEHREAISEDGDRYQDRVLASVAEGGFRIDWQPIFGAIESHGPRDLGPLIHRLIGQQLRSDRFLETDAAIVLNGDLIAQYMQQRHERELATRVQAPVLRPRVEFAEPSLFSPNAAVAYWQTILGLTDEEAAALLESLHTLHSSSFALAGKISTAIMNRVAGLIAETIQKGLTLQDFITQARALLPDATVAILETQYRTRLTTSYGGSRLEQIRERQRVFPFIQYMIIRDSRTTWWICLPMGTAGPGARGFIAAADDPIWLIWRPPNHYNCRSDLSPISYLEAQRLGILSADGRSRIALIGSNPSRPYGEPPKFASDPQGGTLRLVQPALGFG